MDGGTMRQSGACAVAQGRFTGKGGGGKTLTRNEQEFVPKLVVTQVNQAAAAAVQAVGNGVGLATSITHGGNVGGSHGEAEVQVVPPLFSRKGGAKEWVGHGHEPCASGGASIHAMLSTGSGQRVANVREGFSARELEGLAGGFGAGVESGAVGGDSEG